MAINEALFSSNKDTWGTPQNLFDTLHDAFNYNIDAAANSFSNKVPYYFDEAKNGLIQKWKHPTEAKTNVWINPPYSNIEHWTAKCYTEILNKNANHISLLIPSRTDTKYFHAYCFKAEYILFLKGRCKFIDFMNPQAKTTSAPFPSCICLFGDVSDEQLYKIRHLGKIMKGF